MKNLFSSIGVISGFVDSTYNSKISSFSIYYQPENFYFVFYSSLFLFISCLLLFVSYIISESNLYADKMLGYECGFDPFSYIRGLFNIKFCVIGLLFLLFDLEIVLLFPVVLVVSSISVFSFFVLYTFIVILLLGFLYEWKKGCLNWDS